jgi:dTMP kinase
MAYQGHARGVGIELVARLSMIATQGHIPDLTILLDLDPSQVHLRTDVSNDQSGLREDQTRFDKEAQEFHSKVREAFLVLARLYPERIKLIDASRPQEEIHEDILALVKPLL